MRFEQRELKPYSEPVVVEDLQEGTVYFAVNFLDKEMVIPTMEPVVYVGRNLDPDDVDRFYFQDADSYREGIRYATAVPEENNATFYSGAAPIHIFDYEHALDCLLACSLRRKEASGR
jgi:hypothetical protein